MAKRQDLQKPRARACWANFPLPPLFTAAIVAAFSLLVGLYLGQSPTSKECLDTRIARYNLVLDGVVGILTVWGLVWAASEFKRANDHSELELLPGHGTEEPMISGRAQTPSLASLQDTPQDSLPFEVRAWPRSRNRRDGYRYHMFTLLYLVNHSKKPGTYVRIKLTVTGDPAPTAFDGKTCLYADWKNALPWKGVPLGDDKGWVFEHNFGPNLIVHEHPIEIGYLFLGWDGEKFLPKDMPSSLTVKYDLYTADTAESGRLDLQLRWHWEQDQR